VQLRDENIEFGDWQRQGAMEVGVQSGAHFQLRRHDFLTVIRKMKPGLILLFTQDAGFDRLVADALRETGVTLLTTRDVAQALQIVSTQGRELTLALMDFNNGCRGMTLLSAIHTCYQDLPVLVTTSIDVYNAKAVAYANGAKVCLNKPVSAIELAGKIEQLQETPASLVAA
jgi:DNA-binding NtrC family response regulator